MKIDDQYEFAHKNFQEYLAAVEIKRTNQEQILYANYQEQWWKDTILLYAAQLRNPSPFIRRLIQLENPIATSLAYQCLKETSRQLDPDLEADVEAELKTVSSTVQDVRYQKLEQLLKNQQFKDADYETYRLMIETVGKEQAQWFSPEDFYTFPCDDLRTIDQLWVKYSNGKFGFSVQKKIYVEELGGTREYNEKIWDEFCNRVGWRKEARYVSYDDLTFQLYETTPVGHLPAVAFSFSSGGVVWVERRWGHLFSRASHCNL